MWVAIAWSDWMHKLYLMCKLMFKSASPKLDLDDTAEVTPGDFNLSVYE